MIEVKFREAYGTPWQTLDPPEGGHPTGLALMAMLREKIHRNPNVHLAVYVDGVLDVGRFPNTGLNEPLDVVINGVSYTPKNP